MFFSLRVSDTLLSFRCPLNLCTSTGESTGGASSYSACIVGESNRGAIDAGRNEETSECSTLMLGLSESASSTKLILMSGSVSSQASGTPIAGIDQLMMPREDALSSSESFCQRTNIFDEMEKKIGGMFLFYFYII